MTFLPFWAGGLALAAVMVAHWLLTGRLMAVSGRVTALVDRARDGAPEEPEMSDAEMLAAFEAASAEMLETARARGIAIDVPAVVPDAPAAPAVRRAPESARTHLVFFAATLLGGTISAALAGDLTPRLTLRGAAFPALFSSPPLALGVLLLGGVLVGFGTRMAGGCTSGHGLSGTSRLEPGSLRTTAVFFATAIFTSLALEALS